MILQENGFQIPNQSKKIAYLVEKGVSNDALCEVIGKAQKARESGAQVLVVRMNKNRKFEKEQLTAQGYEESRDFYEEELNRG